MTYLGGQATKEDLLRIETAIHELRILLFFLLDPEVSDRFRVGWFGNNPPIRIKQDGMSDIERIDAELDRIRWYISHLSTTLGANVDPESIARALKTGEAPGVDLLGTPEK